MVHRQKALTVFLFAIGLLVACDAGPIIVEAFWFPASQTNLVGFFDYRTNSGPWVRGYTFAYPTNGGFVRYTNQLQADSVFFRAGYGFATNN